MNYKYSFYYYLPKSLWWQLLQYKDDIEYLLKRLLQQLKDIPKYRDISYLSFQKPTAALCTCSEAIPMKNRRFLSTKKFSDLQITVKENKILYNMSILLKDWIRRDLMNKLEVHPSITDLKLNFETNLF